MIRGYDSSRLFRDDSLLRIQQLEKEIAASPTEERRLVESVAARKESMRRHCEWMLPKSAKAEKGLPRSDHGSRVRLWSFDI